MKGSSDMWVNYCPLLYHYLSIHELSDYRTLSNLRCSDKGTQNHQFKYYENLLLVSGKGVKSSGLLSSYEIIIPYFSELGDPRVKPILNRTNHIDFDTPLSTIELIQCQEKEYLLVATQAKNSILMYNLSAFADNRNTIISKSPEATIISEASPSAVNCFLNNTNELIVGYQNGEICILDLQKEAAQRSCEFHKASVEKLCWLDDEKQCFISASRDGNLLMWDKRTQQPCQKISPMQHEILALANVKDKLIASGGLDGEVNLYDIKGGQFCKVQKHKGPVTTLINAPRVGKNGYFCSGSEDGSIIVSESKPQFVHLGHESEISDIDFFPGADLFFSIEKAKTNLMVWKPATIKNG